MSKALVMACHLLVFGARRPRHTMLTLYPTVRDPTEDAVSAVLLVVANLVVVQSPRRETNGRMF